MGRLQPSYSTPATSTTVPPPNPPVAPGAPDRGSPAVPVAMPPCRVRGGKGHRVIRPRRGGGGDCARHSDGMQCNTARAGRELQVWPTDHGRARTARSPRRRLGVPP